MDTTAPIVAGHSIGGIELGSSIHDILPAIYHQEYKVISNIYNNPNGKLINYVFNEGLMAINTDEAGEIISLSCAQPYKGTYQHKLWPGMNVPQVKRVTRKQLLTCGALVTDGELGVYFLLPPPYDEVDYIQQIPDNTVLDTIYVMHRNWRGY